MGNFRSPVRNENLSPGLCDSVVRASACVPKGKYLGLKALGLPMAERIDNKWNQQDSVLDW